MSRSSKSGAIHAPKPMHRHPLLTALNLFLDARFFTALPAPDLRRWTLRTLFLMALLMALSQAPNLAGRFAFARRVVNGWRLSRHVVGKTYQGLIQALTKASPRLLHALGVHLRPQIQKVAGPYWKMGRWVALGVDGSKFDLPRTQAHLDHFGKAGKKRCGPQAYLTTIFHLRTGLPWDARIGRADASERAHLRKMVRHLPQDTLLVADAGFVGYDLWKFLTSKTHFLVRVGGNVGLLGKLGYAVRERGGLVYLWPDKQRKAKNPPLVLRLIRLHDGRKEMALITDVLDPKLLSLSQARECYRLRWGIELWHRQIKQTAGRKKLASGAPTRATLELAFLAVAMTLLRMLAVQDAIRRGEDPQKISPGAALKVLRELAANPHLAGGLGTLRRHLGHCRKDAYERNAPKRRVVWPAKKRDHPPGLPRITLADATQIAAAAELRRWKPRR